MMEEDPQGVSIVILLALVASLLVLNVPALEQLSLLGTKRRTQTTRTDWLMVFKSWSLKLIFSFLSVWVCQTSPCLGKESSFLKSPSLFFSCLVLNSRVESVSSTSPSFSWRNIPEIECLLFFSFVSRSSVPKAKLCDVDGDDDDASFSCVNCKGLGASFLSLSVVKESSF